MSNFTISAVVPAYNNAAFLPSAIDSILKQTCPVDEIIIVDDGSSDNIYEVLEPYGSRIICIHQENAGPAAARNRGIEAATGDWIAFLDADDQWVPTKIELQTALLRRHPELDLVAGDMAEINPDLQVRIPSVLEQHGLKQFFVEHRDTAVPNAMEFLLRKNFIPTGTVLAKKDAILAAGKFNPDIRFGEDLELWAKIAGMGSIACIPEVLMLRTKHENNTTSATEKMLQDLVRVMVSIDQWMKQNKISINISMQYYISKALTDMGYFYFAANKVKLSRIYFFRSYLIRPSLKALTYYTASLLPLNLITMIRNIKKV